MTLSQELKWRGFINQTTLKDLSKLDEKKWTFYHGYDASADSLTVGNLAALMLDKCFIRHGHRAFLLAGGATTLIGDPGGKDEERPLQAESSIKSNVGIIKKQIKKLLGDQAFILNNLEWFKDMTLLGFLRGVGKYFSMTPLVQRDYIAKRMLSGGSGISYAEFSYTLLQGYDFLHLRKYYGVTLQLAGSDQWGNCLSGVELVRKVIEERVEALTMPLVLDQQTGKKFGKSEEGAVWLDSSKTPVADFYQFWVNVNDESVGSYLKIFTELDKEQIAKIMKAFEADKSKRLAQRTLAYEVTKLVHGMEPADQARQHAEHLSDTSLDESGAVKKGDSIIETLVKYDLASSKTEARGLIEAGGVYINNQKVDREVFEEPDFQNDKVILRRGKTLRNTVVLRRK